MEWNKGTIRYVCQKCRQEVEKEQGEIKGATEAEIYLTCQNCINSSEFNSRYLPVTD